MKLRDARAAYFAANGFPADGGYAATWVPLMFGRVRLYLYNAPSRKRAVPIHDLHHILTGYSTTPAGEAEVAAWELGAGTWPYHFATLINLPALLYGLIGWPRRIYRAFVAGRRCSSLYQQTVDASLLESSVDQARQRLLGSARSRRRDPWVFAGFVAAAVLTVLVPIGLLVSAIGALFG